MRDLTPQEQAVLALTTDLWNALGALPEVHINDQQDAIHHIHALQNMIMARPATEQESRKRFTRVWGLNLPTSYVPNVKATAEENTDKKVQICVRSS